MRKLGELAKLHIRKYPQLKDRLGRTFFTYTLLTQEQVNNYGFMTQQSNSGDNWNKYWDSSLDWLRL
jgi:hypothetical protein